MNDHNVLYVEKFYSIIPLGETYIDALENEWVLIDEEAGYWLYEIVRTYDNTFETTETDAKDEERENEEDYRGPPDAA